LGYSFGGLLALELALKLEEEGREGKLYLLDSSPDVMKMLAEQSDGSSDNQFEINVICTSIKQYAPRDATSAAITKVFHDRNVKTVLILVLIMSFSSLYTT
jgi:thioesterase domain-containing protein